MNLPLYYISYSSTSIQWALHFHWAYIFRKNGKKIKPAWLIGGLTGLVVIILALFMFLPKGLSGTYTQTTSFFGVKSETSIKFKGNSYEEVENDNKGTYKISEDKIILTPENSNDPITGTLSKDKKSFKLMGMTYNKK